jgi:hypothetical protein
MLAQYKIDRVRELLGRKWFSLRKIALRTGVSRTKVSEIAAGEFPDRPPPEPEPEPDDFDIPLAPPERCPECGGIVYLPCQVCHVRKLLATHLPQYQLDKRFDYVVGLKLKPRHRKGYEQIRRRRRKLRRRAATRDTAVRFDLGKISNLIFDVRQDPDDGDEGAMKDNNVVGTLRVPYA